MGKNNEYLEISKQIVANIGGMDNIQGTAHLSLIHISEPTRP